MDKEWLLRFMKVRDEAIGSLDPAQMIEYLREFVPEELDNFLALDREWQVISMAKCAVKIASIPKAKRQEAELVLLKAGIPSR